MSPVSNQLSGIDAVVVLLEVALHDRSAAGLQPPELLPSRGRTLPSSSTTRISTPNIERPGRDEVGHLLFVAHQSQVAGGAPTVPIGDISVMPHKWFTRIPVHGTSGLSPGARRSRRR